MAPQKTTFQRVQEYGIALLAKVTWKQTKRLSDEDKQFIQKMLSTQYYVITTAHSNYLTTYLIDLATFLLTFKWGKYSHVLMNVEDTVTAPDDFRFIEAVTTGTRYATFDQVFSGVSSVALLRPKYVPDDMWTEALDKLKVYEGVPYDSLFDLASANEINCVELLWLAVQNVPQYQQRFPHLTYLAKQHPTLTPSMIATCVDFEVAYETWIT